MHREAEDSGFPPKDRNANTAELDARSVKGPPGWSGAQGPPESPPPTSLTPRRGLTYFRPGDAPARRRCRRGRSRETRPSPRTARPGPWRWRPRGLRGAKTAVGAGGALGGREGRGFRVGNGEAGWASDPASPCIISARRSCNRHDQ